jgi:hypothetical protein
MSISYVPGTVQDLHAWYVVDLIRTMSALLAVPPVSTFRAAALAHQFCATSGRAAITPKAHEKPETVHLAASCLLAVAKVDGLPSKLSSIATVCDRVARRRYMMPAFPPTQLLEPSRQELEAIRANIIDYEWQVLEASAFMVTSDIPHHYVLAFVRAVCTDNTSQCHIADPSGEPPLSDAATAFANIAFSFCNDAMRSPTLMLHTDRPIIAAAALHAAAEQSGFSLDAICPEWPLALGAPSRQTVYDAAALLRAVGISLFPPSKLLQVLNVNPNIPVIALRPAVAPSPKLGPAEPERKSKRDKDKRDKDKSKKSKRDKEGKKSKKEKKRRESSTSTDASL